MILKRLSVPNPVRVKYPIRHRRRSLSFFRFQSFLIQFNAVWILTTRDQIHRFGIRTCLSLHEEGRTFRCHFLVWKIKYTVHTNVENVSLDEFSTFWTGLSEVIIRERKVFKRRKLAYNLWYCSIEFVSG